MRDSRQHSQITVRVVLLLQDAPWRRSDKGGGGGVCGGRWSEGKRMEEWEEVCVCLCVTVVFLILCTEVRECCTTESDQQRRV